MLCNEQIKLLRQYTDADIDRLVTVNNQLVNLDPLSVLIARENYQPGFLSDHNHRT